MFRALDVLPCVVATGEFSNFTVRGRGPRDNLILVDDVPFDRVVHFDQTLGEEEDIGGGRSLLRFSRRTLSRVRSSRPAAGALRMGASGSLLKFDVEANPDSSA